MIDARKLDDFGSLTRPLFAGLRAETPPLPSASRLIMICDALQSGFTAARNAGAYANPWTIAGIGRRETRSCAVLARLWDPVIVGDTGRKFLTETLRIADPTGEHAFPLQDIDNQPYSVVCESCLAGDTANRMDIVIQSLGGSPGWSIVIEAKVEANLRINQLKKYARDLVDRSRLTGRATYLVVLSPTSPATLDRKIPHLTWTGIASAAKATIRRDAPPTSPETLIRDFADHITDFDF